MKKITYLFLSAMFMMLFACTEQDVLVPQLDDEVSCRPKGPIIKVYPTGVDDTENLVQAFADAKAAGPGATVQLTEGTFHIGFILIEEFVGTFNGVGMGKTIIEPLDEINCTEILNAQLRLELLKFLRGNIRISNMSLLNLDGEPCSGEELWALLGLHDWANNELPDLPEDHHITAVVDHVEFVSSPGPAGWSQFAVYTGISCGPDFAFGNNQPYSNTDITVTNCTMRDMENAFFNLGIEKGRTVFSNNGPVSSRGGLFILENIGGCAIISGNEFYTTGMGSVYIDNADWNFTEFKLSDGAQYEISHNKFHLKDAWGAITIANDRKAWGIIDNENPLKALIKNNLFDLQGATWIGIWNWITDDAIIRNNIFKGQAKVGIYVDPRTESSLMLGNNFTDLDCTSDIDWMPGFGEKYNILLLGNNNTVIGGNKNGTSVLDLGENNTIFTGVKLDKRGERPQRETLTNNYELWKEHFKNMRKP